MLMFCSSFSQSFTVFTLMVVYGERQRLNSIVLHTNTQFSKCPSWKRFPFFQFITPPAQSKLSVAMPTQRGITVSCILFHCPCVHFNANATLFGHCHFTECFEVRYVSAGSLLFCSVFCLSIQNLLGLPTNSKDLSCISVCVYISIYLFIHCVHSSMGPGAALC